MEMMEGGELFHRISQHRHFTEKMASQVTKQVSETRNSAQALFELTQSFPVKHFFWQHDSMSDALCM